MIPVSVTVADIARGFGGDCSRCAVAMALQRATKDPEAMVFQRDWTIYLSTWSLSIEAPYDVARLVHDFDQQPRTEDGLVDVFAEGFEPMKPIDFELPDQDDPEWVEECCGCEQFFATSELDDEGYCPECRARSADD